MWYLHSTLTYCVVVNTMRSVFLGIFGIIFSTYFESIVEFSVLVSSGQIKVTSLHHGRNLNLNQGHGLYNVAAIGVISASLYRRVPAAVAV